MKNLSLIIIGIGVGAFLTVVVFLLIYTQYSPMQYSITQIGALGDAIGGIANPILTLISIGVLIYITHKVEEVSNKNQEAIANRTYRVAYFEKAKFRLYELYTEWSETPMDETLFKQLYYSYQSFKDIFKDEITKSAFVRLADRSIDEIYKGFDKNLYSKNRQPDIHALGLHLKGLVGEVELMATKIW